MILAREEVARPLPAQPRPLDPARKALLRSERLKLSSLVLLAFSLGVMVVLCEARIAWIGFRLQQFEKEIAAVRMENEALAGAIDQLLAPDRLAQIAVHRLGMVSPPPGAQVAVTLPPLREPPKAHPARSEKNNRAFLPKGLLPAFLELLSLNLSGSAR